MSQQNELKDFWRRVDTVYVNEVIFQNYRYIPIYGFCPPDKIETKDIKSLINKHNPYYNKRVYDMCKRKSNGEIWYKNGYVKIFDYLHDFVPTIHKIEDSTFVTIVTTYIKAYDNMSEMMEHSKPDDFISYMKDRGLTVCPMINK